MSRPEAIAPPEIFYNVEEAQKYASNSRMIEIQSEMSSRAIDLLNLSMGQSAFLLDIGCGSGLSGEVISERGHMWVGVDISQSMLDVAVEREVEGDLVCADMGDGLMFRTGAFDGAISISAVQWLLNQDKSYHSAPKRIAKFFTSLYKCLVRGGKAILQVYPETPLQMELLTTAAMKAGFSGGLVIDYPNSTKAKKYYLCLCAGTAELNYQVPAALTDEKEDKIQFSAGQKTKKSSKPKNRAATHRDWVLQRKERLRRKGIQVKPDSKYTGRTRVKF